MKTYHVRRVGDDDYLQHWSLKGAHKYIAKIDLGGKFRYFYNQAEIEAYKAAKAAGGAINKAVGQAGKNIQGAYRVVRKGAQDAMNNAGREISSWKRKASKVIGLDARKDMNRKWGALEKTASGIGSKAHENKLNRWFDSRQAYEKTPLGRLESAKNRAVENAQQAWYGIEKKAGALGKDASKAASDAYKVVRKAADDAGNAVKGAQKNVQNAAATVGKNVTGAVKNAQKQVENTVKGAKKAYKSYQDFKKLPEPMQKMAANVDRAGQKKLLGHNVQGAATAEKLYNIEKAITNAPKNAQKAVSDAGKNISKAASGAVKNAQKVADDVGRNVSKTASGAVKSAQKAVNDAGKNASRLAGDVSKNVSRLASDAGKAASKAAYKASTTVNRTVGKAEKAIGINDARILNKAEKGLRKAQGYTNDGKLYGPPKNNSQTKTAQKTVDRAQANFDKTPLGKVAKAGNNISKALGTAPQRSGPVNQTSSSKPKLARTYNTVQPKQSMAAERSRTQTQANLAKSLSRSGKTYAQIAKQLGISESQVASLLRR